MRKIVFMMTLFVAMVSLTSLQAAEQESTYAMSTNVAVGQVTSRMARQLAPQGDGAEHEVPLPLRGPQRTGSLRSPVPQGVGQVRSQASSHPHSPSVHALPLPAWSTLCRQSPSYGSEGHRSTSATRASRHRASGQEPPTHGFHSKGQQSPTGRKRTLTG
jgi:hypothetical protein